MVSFCVRFEPPDLLASDKLASKVNEVQVQVKPSHLSEFQVKSQVVKICDSSPMRISPCDSSEQCATRVRCESALVTRVNNVRLESDANQPS